MFRVADRFVEEEADDLFVPPPAALPSAPDALPRLEAPPARYGARRGLNYPAVLVIVLLHAVLIAALVQARHHAQRARETRLSVVNLMPPPPPPPSQEAPPPPPQTKIVAPPPLVQVPVPAPVMATTPDIVAPAPPSPAVAVSAPPAPPSAATGSSTVQGGDLSAQMVAGKPPRYPVESRRKREQGTVVLALTLGLDGAVESLSIAQSSGFPRLDNAARDAVRGWRWKPVMRDGQAVRVKGVVEIPFVLRSETD
ncbi:TonB family protein [Sphingobium chlorophenolicum L-1]|uniref:TonB family protein n=1 Tax=Sphingobium chlorophenolicum L-1 TaxID=690566 RepID=F6F2S3_SPHCR|nr:energy transducer TonB [Sphingobium chlorophenolicum]AEG50735.1 TonB family protein [Sphingobium chlorophenolicum L-1]